MSTPEPIGSTIDKNRYRQVNKLTIDKPIDYDSTKIKEMINDPTLGEKYIQHAIKKLGFSNVFSIAEYVIANADHAGKAFIGLCQKEIRNADN